VSTPAGTPRVAVCVATFRRPAGLERLLHGLEGLAFAGEAPSLEIVVVDNDPEQSARATCEALRPGLRWPLRYEPEPRRGISHARNRAVAASRSWADFVAFIDDDEAPEPDWIEQLLRVQASYDADVVCGPVIRHFESEPPEWVKKGGFFVDARYPTGTDIPDPATNNVLIRTAVFGESDEPFDLRFGLTGGEDTHFFLRLGRAGRKMVWADEARVNEWVPVSRASGKWVLQRVYRTSNTWSICERELHPTFRAAGMRVAKGMARIAYGLAILPVSWLFGRHMVVKSLWYVCWGAGNITGLMGLKFHEYRVVHGK
jgi:succinoglycan biosynthesis protein ExoM